MLFPLANLSSFLHRIQHFPQEGVFDAELNIKPENVLSERQVVRWRNAAPVGVVEQLETNARICDIANAHLHPEGIQIVLVEPIHRLAVGDGVERFDFPSILPIGNWRFNPEPRSNALDVGPFMCCVTVGLAKLPSREIVDVPFLFVGQKCLPSR